MLKWIGLLSGLVIATNTFQVSANVAPHPNADGKRLIELSDGSRHWMTEPEILRLSHEQHEKGRCGGFMDVTETADLQTFFLEPLQPVFQFKTPDQQTIVNRLLPELSATKLRGTVEHLSSYHSRYYQSETGVQSAHWIRDQFIALAAHRSDVSVRLVEHSFRQPSVVARIEGTGKNSDEIVVLGGHQDSINAEYYMPNPSGRAPGADDNASGTATLLEVFRVLAQSDFRPARTIEFMAYAGEEVGLRGSQDIARRYQTEGQKVVAVIQFDMTMYPGSGNQMVLIKDHVNPKLTDFVGTLIQEYVGIQWVEDTCGYACSDHASWTRAGFPAAFPFEAATGNMNRRIHTTGDTLENQLDAAHGLHFAKLGLAFAVELSAR